MAAPNVAGRIIRRLRAERSSRCGALRFRASPEASCPPPWAPWARLAQPPEPDDVSGNRLPTPTERRTRFPVRGVFVFGGTQS